MGEAAYVPDPSNAARFALLELYYKERTFFGNNGAYTDDLETLRLGDAPDGVSWPPAVHVWPGGFEATLTAGDGTVLHVNHEGRLW